MLLPLLGTIPSLTTSMEFLLPMFLKFDQWHLIKKKPQNLHSSKVLKKNVNDVIHYNELRIFISVDILK